MEHSTFSPSGAETWFRCAGSINAQKGMPNESTDYSSEGTDAHALAESCLINHEQSPNEYVNQYLDYVNDFVPLSDREELYIENRLYFESYAPGGFGTVDSLFIDYSTSICHIFDFKYGAGIRVGAEFNKQMMIYGLGVLDSMKDSFMIDKFELHIIQPRMSNIVSWTISTNDLREFGEVLREKVKASLLDAAPRVPGLKQCQWCSAKAFCPELEEKVSIGEIDNVIKGNKVSISELEKIPDSRIKDIMDSKKLSAMFMKAVSARVYTSLENGDGFEGYKIVKARKNRVWREEAYAKLVELLGDEALKSQLIGVGVAEKLIGKELVSELSESPEGGNVVVPDSDKRPSIIDNDFDDLTLNN